MNETFHRFGIDNLKNNNFHRLFFEENEEVDIYRDIELDSAYTVDLKGKWH